MKTFLVIIDGQEDVVKAKVIGNDCYYVKETRTGNKFKVKWFSPRYDDNGRVEYDIAQFYQTSPYGANPLLECKVVKLD